MGRSKRKLRAGVIGTGMGAHHMEGYASHPRCELAAICDIDLPRARSFAEKHGVKHVFRNYRDLVTMDDLDLVSVAVPNYLHARMTIAALEAGKDVLCEKPMATKLSDAEAMVRTAKRAKRRLMINMSYRFNVVQEEVGRRIEGGELGEIYYAKSRYTRRKGMPSPDRTWFLQKSKAGGGASVDLGVHSLDLVWWLIGQPKPKLVLGGTFSELLPGRMAKHGVKANVDDLAAAMVRFEGGQVIFFEASWDGHNPGEYGYEIYGTKSGVSCHDREGELKVTLHSDNKKGGDSDRAVKWRGKDVSAYWHFVDACLDRRKSMMASGEECLPVARMLDAMMRSEKTGKAIEL